MVHGAITIEFETGKDPLVTFKGIVEPTDFISVIYYIRMAYQTGYLDPKRQEELRDVEKNKEILAEQQKVLALKKTEDDEKKVEEAKQQVEKEQKDKEEKRAKVITDNELLEAQRILKKANQPNADAERIKWANEIVAKNAPKIEVKEETTPTLSLKEELAKIAANKA